MKKLNRSLFAFITGAALIVSCGGGGLSEDFKKEMAEFETAWGNAKNSVVALNDSVHATIDSWGSMESCTAPDSLTAELAPAVKSQLDSVENICKNYSADLEKLHQEIEMYVSTFEADSKAWADWKNKVEKGEIDVETAKKDMKVYKEKIVVINDWVKQTDTKFTTIKSSCEINCAGYGEILTKAALTEEVN